MKSNYTSSFMIGASVLLIALLPGCYTQLATMKEEQTDDQMQYASETQDTSYQYTQAAGAEQYPESGQTVASSYYDDWRPSHFGYSYYYPSYYWPSYAFSVAYADPWHYDAYWAYDPWWCGTPYVGYGWGHYPGGYYYPPYAYYPYGGKGNNPAANNRTRTFGAARGGGSRGTVTGGGTYGSPTTTGGDRGGSNLEPGRVLSRGTFGASGPSGGAAGKNGSPQAAPARGGNNRNAGTRVPAYTPTGYTPPTRQPASGNDDHQARGTGSSRGSSTPSYNPPPSRAPSPTPAPAPSSGSTGRTTSGSTRGGRNR